jgi:hypothetical protein
MDWEREYNFLMAHFAKLDDNNVVLEVNVVNNDVLDPQNEEASGIAFLTEWSGGYTNWVQTSYNGSKRKNFAGIGYYYDSEFDAFRPPKPYPSWKLDYETFQWNAPVPMPEKEPGYGWEWNEVNLEWVKFPIQIPTSVE